MSTIRRRTLLGGVGAAFFLTSCTPPESTEPEQPGFEGPTDLAEPGESIPEVEMPVGFSPYADELLAVAGIENGYFADVGLTLTPEPNGTQVDLIASLTPLLNDQIKVGSGYAPAIAAQLDSVNNVVAFCVSDVYYGYHILAPKGKYTTVSQALAEGLGYGDAVAKVVEQMRGQPVILREGVVPDFYNLMLAKADMTLDDLDVSYLANPDVVRAGFVGQADFASPTGAVELTKMMLDGWESLVDIRTAIEHEESAATVSLRSTFSGYLTTTDYAEQNYESLLRFTSVIYRLVDDLEKDPEETVSRYLDYLNQYTGSKIKPEELAGTFDGLYSARNFEDAVSMYQDPEDPFHFDTVMGAQIDALETSGVLKGNHGPDNLSIAGQIHADLVRYKEAADEALTKAPDGDHKTLAEEQYEARNYVDAYRLAAFASS